MRKDKLTGYFDEDGRQFKRLPDALVSMSRRFKIGDKIRCVEHQRIYVGGDDRPAVPMREDQWRDGLRPLAHPRRRAGQVGEGDVMAKLKVYGFRGYRVECPAAPSGSRQTREIVATTSKTKARSLGEWSTSLSEICETGNAGEIAAAMAEPGTVFWSPINAYPPVWTKAASRR